MQNQPPWEQEGCWWDARRLTVVSSIAPSPPSPPHPPVTPLLCCCCSHKCSLTWSHQHSKCDVVNTLCSKNIWHTLSTSISYLYSTKCVKWSVFVHTVVSGFFVNDAAIRQKAKRCAVLQFWCHVLFRSNFVLVPFHHTSIKTCSPLRYYIRKAH